MKWGDYTIETLELGRFRLDGGAMFGSVPKALWSRQFEADSLNRIDLALRCLYMEGQGRRILVDTGMGDKWSPEMVEMLDIRMPTGGLTEVLAPLKVTPEQITDVILTHLHFDHAGGATRQNDSGEFVPTFPNATYYLQRRNLEWARKPNEKERASYLPEN